MSASIAIGLALALCIFSSPQGALAALLGNAFVAGFIYIGWLIYSATKGNDDLVAQEKMKAYRRAIEGKRPLQK